MLLKEKKAVITGCNKGIGKEIVENFSMNGADIVACVRKKNDDFKNFTNELEIKYKNKISIYEMDLSSQESVKVTANNIIKEHDKIEILVNNAAAIFTAIFQMTSIEKVKELFQTNFFSQTLFTQIVLKSIIKNKKGSIINISSTAGIDGGEGRSLYVASKAAIIAQTKSLSKELGRLNIRVNSIAPGLTNTEMMKNNTKKEIIDRVIFSQAIQRVGEPEDVANVSLFLASDLSNFITGQTIRVDGGV